MTGVGVTQDVALDRKEWKRRTRPTPRRLGKGHQGEQGEQDSVHCKYILHHMWPKTLRRDNSRTGLERPPLLPSKSGRSRQVVCHNRYKNHILTNIQAYENGRSIQVVSNLTGRTQITYYNKCLENGRSRQFYCT